MKKVSILIILLGLILLMQSCATILGGSRKAVIVKAGNPPNAKVYYNGAYVGVAPIRVKVPKSARQGNSYIEIKADGYKPEKINLTRKVSFGYTLLDIITGVVWLGIDFATGNIYKPRPHKIYYNLELKKGYKARFKAGDSVFFTKGKYKNQKGKIIVLYPDRALIQFKRKPTVLEKLKGVKEDVIDKVEVPLSNVAKQ